MSDWTRTGTTLLEGLQDPHNTRVWGAFVERYQPLIMAYARRRGLQDADAEDVAQETLADFARAYRAGQYDRTRGRLRHWLGGFARHRIARRLTELGHQIRPVQFEGKTAVLQGVPDPETPDATWDEEWERHILALCRTLVRHEFEDRSFRAFEEYVINGRPAELVATDMGMTTNSLYVVKSRILARIRELSEQIECTG